MVKLQRVLKQPLWVALGATAVLVAGCASTPKGQIVLTGAQEVPPVSTKAEGRTDIAIRYSKCPSAASSSNCPWVSGSVVATGMVGTAAHIHRAPAGQNGPVVLPLEKTADNTWMVPANTAVTEEQITAWQNGEFYVNVHSEANPGGEIRGQLKP